MPNLFVQNARPKPILQPYVYLENRPDTAECEASPILCWKLERGCVNMFQLL